MQISARLTFESHVDDEEHRGLISQKFNVLPQDDFTDLLCALIAAACEFAVSVGKITSTDELQGFLARTFEWTDGLIVEDVGDEVCHLERHIEKSEG